MTSDQQANIVFTLVRWNKAGPEQREGCHLPTSVHSTLCVHIHTNDPRQQENTR